MSDDRLDKLRKRLDDMHQWPSVFMFKFILPNDPDKISSLKQIFGDKAEFSARASRKNNYVSLTIKEMMLDADSIFDRYRAASAIEGVISL